MMRWHEVIERLKKNVSVMGVVIAFVVGTLVGPGAFWQWQPHVLDKVVKTTELRKQENDLYSKIIEISEEYGKYQALSDILGAKTELTPSEMETQGEASLKVFRLKPQLDVMKDDLKVLEAKLSQLEGREPRRITLEFPLPPKPSPARFFPPAQPVSKLILVHVQ